MSVIEYDRAAKDLPNLVYIHIGKTAGTSLRTTLTKALPAACCSTPFIQSYMSELDAAHYRQYPIICGHISRADQQKWFPDRSIITALREPIDRAISFIYYVRSLPKESSVAAMDAHQLSLMDFIETEAAQQNLHNTMVRQLGGHMLDEPLDFPALLEAAKQTLREAIWVGRRETMSADLPRLGALLGHKLEMAHENITPHRPSIAAEHSKVLERLETLNQYDVKLWRWAAKALGPDSKIATDGQKRDSPSPEFGERERQRCNAHRT